MTSEANKKNMLIIDGNSILNRAFFGMPALTNSRGADTGALYGMMTIIPVSYTHLDVYKRQLHN